jgi:pimeloyl-ACP methyl ester carboxylesterase
LALLGLTGLLSLSYAPFSKAHEVPEDREYIYSFDRLAATLNAFTQALKIRRYVLYVFGYGAPTGLRLAMAHPDRVSAIISQNNAYEEENREVLRQNILNFEETLDAALLERPGNKDIQLDLFRDYASNVKLYPAFQDYFRKAQPPFLAIWGKNDPFSLPAGAEAFRRDMPAARVEFLDTGHFALQTHVVEIAAAMKEFFTANGASL